MDKIEKTGHGILKEKNPVGGGLTGNMLSLKRSLEE